ncbi:MAG TPA: hypothetical protein VFA37_00940 [Gaiellaceae bacterium]|nr:hypothetical protein [Gaiellaceae bacterium]
MSISGWFKRLFSPAPTDAPLDVAAATDDEKSLDEARIDAGGGGALGLPGDPSSHASPGEEIAESASEGE